MSLQLRLNKRDNEISELKGRIKSLNEEVTNILNFKSRFEILKAENIKLMEVNNNMEDHIKALESELAHQENKISSKPIDFEFKNELERQVVIYSEKIRSLESKLEEKEKELRDERVDTDLKRKRESNLIEEGFQR